MTETRTIVLTEDGRHVSVGRATEPSVEEIAALAASLTAQGLAGWLVRMEGVYYSKRGNVTLTEVQQLGAPRVAFAEAEAAFQAARKAAVSH